MAATAIRRGWMICGAGLISTAVVATVVGADAPPAPKQSTVASAKTLSAAVDDYLADLKPLLADEATYTKSAEQVGLKANAVTALALVLGNHDESNTLQSGAIDAVAASKELTRAKDFATAAAAWTKLQAAVAKSGNPAATPAWERAASMGRLMTETAAIQGRLNRNLRRLDRTKDDNIRGAATLAAFAQAMIYDTHEVKNPADMDKWYKLMTAMRTVSTELTKQYEAGDAEAVKYQLSRLEKSCAACHAVFQAE